MSQEKATASRGSHYVVTEKYLLTRGADLQLPAKQFQSFIHDKNTIYGMVIDMPMNPALLCSLVVYINGAANVYFNNGAEYSGAAQRYQTVVQPAQLLMANASRILGEAKKTKQFDLPVGPTHHIFLITQNGIYKKSVLPAHIFQESKDMQSIFALYQRVMAALHTAQLKDRANRTQA